MKINSKISFQLFAVGSLVMLLAGHSFAYNNKLKNGSDFSFLSGYYRYQEPSLMHMRAVNFGLNYTGTLVFDYDWLLRGDLLGMIGINTKYSSYNTGSIDNEKNWYADLRVLPGRNFEFNNFAIESYTGFGYRYLYNDGRGTSSTGHAGYRRASNYFYLPFGLTHKLELNAGEHQIITNLEFDFLLLGKQITYLTDVATYDRDLRNTQKNGYGVRFSSLYRVGDFSFGPYLIYWDIDGSDSIAYKHGAAWEYGTEPRNNTIEAGLKISCHF